jgi:CheY-like chemotaxis protein
MATSSGSLTGLLRFFTEYASGNPISSTEIGEELRPLRMLVIMTLVGMIVLLLYGLHDLQRFFVIIAVGLMVAGAALVVGGLLGFLFGIPRTVQNGDVSANGSVDLASGAPVTRYGANTNLERVSDWLTTLLVALTVIELPNIWQGLIDVSQNLEQGFGVGPSAQPMALVTLLYFAAIGFMFGFLWTRLFLPVAYVITDDALRVRKAEEQTIVNLAQTLESRPNTALSMAAPASAENAGGQRLALWVDDRPSNNSELVTSFEKLFDLKFDLALTTEDAVARATPGKYRLIISDMSRPPDPRAGYTLLQRLQAQGVHAPFIIYAGRGADSRARAEAAQLGAFGVTNSPNELLQLVRTALEVQPVSTLE